MLVIWQLYRKRIRATRTWPYNAGEGELLKFKRALYALGSLLWRKHEIAVWGGATPHARTESRRSTKIQRAGFAARQL